MDDYVKYIVMYDNPWRDGEATVKNFFNTEDEAHDYVKGNPGDEWPVLTENPQVGDQVVSKMEYVPNYVVEARTTYKRLEKRS